MPRRKVAAPSSDEAKRIASLVIQEVFQELTKSGVAIPLRTMSAVIAAVEKKLNPEEKVSCPN